MIVQNRNYMASSEMQNLKQTYIHVSSKYKICGHFRSGILYVVKYLRIFAIACKQENIKILFFLLSISMPRDRLMLILHVTVKSTFLWVIMPCCLENASHFRGTYYSHLMGQRVSQARNHVFGRELSYLPYDSVHIYGFSEEDCGVRN
jgi:hypothetical protein